MADNPWAAAGYRPVTPTPSPIERQREVQIQGTLSNMATDSLRRAEIGLGMPKIPLDTARTAEALTIDRATRDAQIVKAQADAKKAQMEAAEDERQAPKLGQLATIPGASEAKIRIGLGLGPAIIAQKHMWEEEGWGNNGRGRNPFLSSPGAVIAKVTENIPLTGLMGGETFQRYQQAAKSWESAFLPIFSGAQVSPSEAKRQIKARLPDVDDSPTVLSRKAVERAMMMNGSAEMLGQPRPFPKMGSLYFSPEKREMTETRPTTSAAVPTKLPLGETPASARTKAKAAIAAGKDPAAIISRLKSWGVDPSGL